VGWTSANRGDDCTEANKLRRLPKIHVIGVAVTLSALHDSVLRRSFHRSARLKGSGKWAMGGWGVQGGITRA
jgi:hypothetical protein